MSQTRDFVTVQSRLDDRSHRSGYRQHREVVVGHVSVLARAGQQYTTEKELDLGLTLAENQTARQ